VIFTGGEVGRGFRSFSDPKKTPPKYSQEMTARLLGKSQTGLVRKTLESG